MAMVPLKVASVPADTLTETNCIYVHPAEGCASAKFAKVREFVFSVRTDDNMKPGHLGMNSIQRKCAGVTATVTDIVEIPAKGWQPAAEKAGVCVAGKLEIEHVSASKKGGEIDVQFFSDYFKKMFAGQYFRVGQQLAVILDSNSKYIARWVTMEAMTAAKEAAEFGSLTADTNVVLTTKEKCEITLTNVPDSQLDSQQQTIVNNFDLENLGIGGLKTEFGNVFRRAFASRIFPQSIVKKLGIKHVKGVLLYGPPGTGKTLIARKIGEILNCRAPKIVNGPEVFNKFVGGTEENIRKLFADAEAEQAAKGDQSGLHLIIFDEFDAICKQRGAVRDSTGVSDNVVNQLLSKIDGVSSLNNVLLIGMTNRKDLIDDAILRPGRFEVHVEIGLPNEEGRQQVFRIHTRNMRERGILGSDVDIAALAAQAKNFSGAEIEGVVRSATSHAFKRHIDFENPTQTIDPAAIKITMNDFVEALKEVQPAFGCATDECESAMRGGIIDYGPVWRHIDGQLAAFTAHLAEGSRIDLLSVLLDGSAGCGKSAVAARLGIVSEFPYVKFITPDNMVAYGELQKANIVRKAFEDAYKSKLSVIILDDLERLIEYSHMGGRYSNVLLQTILVLCKRQPPEGHKLLVVGTTSLPDVLDTLEVTNSFSLKLHIPDVESSALLSVVKGMEGVSFKTKDDERLCLEAMPDRVPIKKLLLVIEMAADGEGGGSTQRHITYKNFAEAMLSAGLS